MSHSFFVTFSHENHEKWCFSIDLSGFPMDFQWISHGAQADTAAKRRGMDVRRAAPS